MKVEGTVAVSVFVSEGLARQNSESGVVVARTSAHSVICRPFVCTRGVLVMETVVHERAPCFSSKNTHTSTIATY